MGPVLPSPGTRGCPRPAWVRPRPAGWPIPASHCPQALPCLPESHLSCFRPSARSWPSWGCRSWGGEGTAWSRNRALAAGASQGPLALLGFCCPHWPGVTCPHSTKESSLGPKEAVPAGSSVLSLSLSPWWGRKKPDHFSCRVLVLSASSLEAGHFGPDPLPPSAGRPELGLIPDPLAHLIVSLYAAWSKPHHPSHPNSGPEAPASLLPSSCVTLPKPALPQVKSTDRGRLASPDHALLTSRPPSCPCTTPCPLVLPLEGPVWEDQSAGLHTLDQA